MSFTSPCRVPALSVARFRGMNDLEKNDYLGWKMQQKQKCFRHTRQAGQSSIEYIIVVAMGVLILIEGGSSAPVLAVAAAIKDAYQGFAYAISLSSNLMATL